MNKAEFLDRLKNPERYIILTKIREFRVEITANYRHIVISYDEKRQGHHLIKLAGLREHIQDLLTVLTLTFPIRHFSSDLLERNEHYGSDSIDIVYVIREHDHIK